MPLDCMFLQIKEAQHSHQAVVVRTSMHLYLDLIDGVNEDVMEILVVSGGRESRIKKMEC